MKNKSKLAKKLPVSKEVSPPAPPLKADELIDLLERCHDKNQKLVGTLVADSIPTLLFIQKALDEGLGEEEITLTLPDRKINYCHGAAGVADILRLLIPALYEAWNKMDLADLEVGRAIQSYRKTHPKDASA